MKSLYLLLAIIAVCACEPSGVNLIKCRNSGNKWASPPVCYYEFYVSDKIVQSAQAAFDKIYGNNAPICQVQTGPMQKFYIGAIVINETFNMDKGIGGFCHISYMDPDGAAILAANVEINSHQPCDLDHVVEHEIRHALGWCHSDDKNDIMFPYCDQITEENENELW